MNLSDILEKFGLKDSKSLGLYEGEKEAIEESIGCPSSLSKFLIYRYYEQETGIFYNSDNFKGFMFEIEPLVGIDETVQYNIERFFSDEIPDNCYIQFLLIGSHKIMEILDIWSHGRCQEEGMLSNLTKKRLDFLENHAFEGILARNYRIIVSVSQKSKSIATISTFKERIINRFDSWKLSPQELLPQDLIDISEEICQMEYNIHQKGRKYQDFELLNNQIFSNGKLMEINEDNIECEGLVTKLYRVREFPENYSISEMINLLGEVCRTELPILGRMLMSFSVATNVTENQVGRVVARGNNATKSARQKYAQDNLTLHREAGEWIEVLDDLRNHKKLINYNFTVALTSKKEEIGAAEANLIALYGLNRWDIRPARHIHQVLLFSLLPMQVGYYWNSLSFLKTTRMAMSSEATALVPLHGEWKGMKTSGMIFFARRGQLFNWNPFVKLADGNFNVAVFGPSGSGKSVWLQELVVSMLALKKRVFILDIGQSFKNLSDLLNGDMVKFTADAKLSLNPFAALSKASSREDLDNAITYSKEIICTMCGANSNKLYDSLIQQAIARAIEKYKDKANITIIARELVADGTEEGQKLSQILYPYTEDGIYGKYFDGEINTKFEKDITVFEFEEIKNDQNLLPVVLQIIGMQILMQFLCGDRTKEFLLIVDEAWMILDYCAKFLTNLARTVRKYGGSLVTCVQGYKDFTKTADHLALFENSTWTVMLKQSAKTIDALRTSEAYKDMIPLIKSVTFVPGKYSECLISASSLNIVGRLMLDPYAGKLFSTDSKDFAFINRKKAEGKTMAEAIEMLVEGKK